MLIFDVVGFSSEMVNTKMSKIVGEIQKAIWDILEPKYYWAEKEEDSDKNDFILIPTGDGYGLVLNNLHEDEDIFDIAVNLYKALVAENLKIRMGIAKGWNVLTIDSNDNLNVFGYGIVLTTRVCNAASDGQILVHANFAETLLQKKSIKEFQKIAEPIEVKHGLILHCYNYYKEKEFGISI